MKARLILLAGMVGLLCGLGLLTGCASDGGGSSSTNTTVYYGVGFSDPWYYGHDCDDDIVINPPPTRPVNPDRPDGAHPSHPIAGRPSRGDGVGGGDRVSARPMPSIPSTPRVSAGGGRGGRGR